MTTTRDTLEQFATHLDESMGVRNHEPQPRLSPIPASKDIGRRPIRNVGKVDIKMVMPDPNQPRTEFPEEAIDRLAKSIREKGQLSAIRVRWSEMHSKWVIISGERRWRATMRAELPTIDCYFHENELAKTEILEQQLIENCLRENLQPVEEANAFANLMELNRWNGKQLAEALRIHPSKITRALALLKLPSEILDSVAAGDMSTRAAYELSKLPDENARRELAGKALVAKFTHEQAARAVRQLRGRRKAMSHGTRQVFSTDLGWKIVVSAKKKGTYDEIEKVLLSALEEVRHRIRNNVQLY